MAVKPETRPKPGSPTPPRPPLQFGKPEKINWLGIILFVAFVASAIAIGVWLIGLSPRLRPLDCDTTSGMGSLTSFGGCHEEGE